MGSNSLPRERGKSKEKRYTALIIVATVTILFAGLFYYLYTAYPNMPSLDLQEEGYKVTAVVEFPKKATPVGVYRNQTLVSNLQTAGSHFLEYSPPGEHT